MPTRVVRLRVGGITLCVRSDRPTDALAMPPGFVPFLTTRGADIVLQLRLTMPPPLPGGPPLFDSGGLWRVYRSGDRLLYTFTSSAISNTTPYKVLEIDAAFRRGTLFFHHLEGASSPQGALEYPLDELLFQYRLVHERALEVHACGVVLHGRAVLFCGQSGAGKSTTARLWQTHRPGISILSDDRVILRPRGRATRAYGTPWHGDGGFGSALARPLAAVFFLHHAGAHAVRPLAGHEATARLIARGFFPTWDQASIERVIETAGAIGSAVPCYELGFLPDPSVLDLVERILADGLVADPSVPRPDQAQAADLPQLVRNR